MDTSNTPIQHKYDAYFIENKPGEDFISSLPKGCYGAIGITLDSSIIGYKHFFLEQFTHIASEIQKETLKDSFHAVDLNHMMHGFVVISQEGTKSLNVCEAIGEGFVAAEIKMGDWDWTSMILFVPKDVKVADQIVQNSMLELKSDQSGQVAKYGYLDGFLSVFTKKAYSENNREILASEMVDFIKSRSIRTEDNTPKKAVCSQLAMRVLRASTLIAAISKNDLDRYETLSDKRLKAEILTQFATPHSSIDRAYANSKIFEVEATCETLPYELFLALKRESDLH